MIGVCNMNVKYIYNNIEYATEKDVRKAIFEKDRVAFSKLNTTEEWLKFGVTYIEEEEQVEIFKQRKFVVIKQKFLDWRNNQATLISSLGFKADSNERANMDVSGLLVAYEDNQEALITFRDADNEFHSLTYAQLKTLQKEIIENGNHAYAQKWALDAQVEKATSKEELDAIEVIFEGKNFLGSEAS